MVIRQEPSSQVTVRELIDAVKRPARSAAANGHSIALDLDPQPLLTQSFGGEPAGDQGRAGTDEDAAARVLRRSADRQSETERLGQQRLELFRGIPLAGESVRGHHNGPVAQLSEIQGGLGAGAQRGATNEQDRQFHTGLWFGRSFRGAEPRIRLSGCPWHSRDPPHSQGGPTFPDSRGLEGSLPQPGTPCKETKAGPRLRGLGHKGAESKSPPCSLLDPEGSGETTLGKSPKPRTIAG